MENNEKGLSLADLGGGMNKTKGTEKAIEIDNPEDIFKDLLDKDEPVGIDSTKVVATDKTPGVKELDLDGDDLPDPLKNALKTIKNTDSKELEKELDNDNDSDADDLGEYESDVVNFFTNKLSEKLNWELEDDEKPKSVDDILGLLEKVIEDNSKPSFASEEIANLNEFVENGGKVADYYKTLVVDRLPLDTIDIESESHQKAILKEDLKNKGLKDEQINRKIQRWEDAGVLQEEAEEALESVKEYRAETEQKLLENQKKQKQDFERAQQQFFTSVDKTIKDTKEVLGFPVNDKTKKELVEYIFKPDADGSSKFFKDTGLVVTHSTNPKKLLEIAYSAKNGETLINKIEKKVESNAAKTLKERLSTKGQRGVNQSSENNSTASIFSSLSSQLLPKR